MGVGFIYLFILHSIKNREILNHRKIPERGKNNNLQMIRTKYFKPSKDVTVAWKNFSKFKSLPT